MPVGWPHSVLALSQRSFLAYVELLLV